MRSAPVCSIHVAGRVAYLLEPGPDEAGDVHLREAHAFGDLGLSEVFYEAQAEDQALALG